MHLVYCYSSARRRRGTICCMGTTTKMLE